MRKNKFNITLVSVMKMKKITLLCSISLTLITGTASAHDIGATTG